MSPLEKRMSAGAADVVEICKVENGESTVSKTTKSNDLNDFTTVKPALKLSQWQAAHRPLTLRLCTSWWSSNHKQALAADCRLTSALLNSLWPLDISIKSD